MPRVLVVPRPGVSWYCKWDGTNFDELVSFFPPVYGVDFSVDEETQDLVWFGVHFPLGSNMTLSGGVTAFDDEYMSANYQVVDSLDVKYQVDEGAPS